MGLTGTAVNAPTSVLYVQGLPQPIEVYAGQVDVRDFATYQGCGGGAVDDSGTFQLALTALSGTGIALYVPAGTYQIANPVFVPSNTKIVLGAGATLTSNMAQAGGNTSNIFYANGNPVGNQTSLAANVTVGSKTFSFTSVSGYSVGSPVLIHSAIDAFYAPYIIQSITGSGPYTVTVDRPILKPFISGDVVQTMGNLVQNISIIGEKGATLAGTGDRLIDIEDGWDIYIAGLTFNSSVGSYACAIRFCQRVVVERCTANFVANTAQAFLFEGGEYITWRDCQVNGAFSNYSFGFETTDYASNVDCSSIGGVDGIKLYQAGSDPVGPRNTTIVNFFASGNSTAGIEVLGCLDVEITNCTTIEGGNNGLHFFGGTGIKVTGHVGGGNTGYDASIAVDCEINGMTCLATPYGGTSGVSAAGVVVSGSANVKLHGLKLNGGSLSSWIGVYNSGTGRVTVTGSDIRGTGASAKGIYSASTGSGIYVDSTDVVVTNGLWVANTEAPIVAGPLVDLTGCTTPVTGTVQPVQRAGIKSVATTGGTTSLTAIDVMQNDVLEITGTLTSNATINVWPLVGAGFAVANKTSGAFTVTVQATGGSGSTITQGKRATGYVDGSTTWQWDGTER